MILDEIMYTWKHGLLDNIQMNEICGVVGNLQGGKSMEAIKQVFVNECMIGGVF